MDFENLIEFLTKELRFLGVQLSTLTVDKWITLGLALYGAGLSTYLAVREWKKGKRRIIIILEFLRLAGCYLVVITNVGHRPITILDIAVRIPYARLGPSQIWGEKPPFPVTLNDGEYVADSLSQLSSGFITKAKRNIWIIVRDSENRQYGRYKAIFHDESTGMTHQID
jgi:hypothetical protein